MRNSTTTAAFAVVTAAVLTGSSGHPAAAGSQAGEQHGHDHPLVLTWVDTVSAASNTDIDLGAPGLSAGNQQLFRDDLFRGGHRIGTTVGVAEVVAVSTTTLTAQVMATTTLAAGQLTTQAAFTEVLAQGPPKVLYGAITGGTGAYRNARGECRGESLSSSDDAKVTCTVLLDD